MVFNTGAALLDAIVLAVVSKEEETGDITRLRRPAKKSWQNTAASGNRILRKYQNYFQERSQKNE